MEDDNKFLELFKLDVNENVEKKGQFKYLSWAWAWAEFLKFYPNATYEIIKNPNGLPFFSDATVGGMVYTKVKVGSITHEMWLPIMDMKNQSKKVFDMMDVNKAVMRCLVKNLAMFGLGLYIYAGEDLPESDEEPQPTQQKALAPSKSKTISDEQFDEISDLIRDTDSDIEKFCGVFKIASLKEMPIGHYEKAIELLNKKLAEKVMG